MITYHDGDILTSNADVICHQVNCKGVMGAGLAKQIKSKYPKVYEQYRDRCYYAVGNLLGINQYIQVDDDKWIANLFCQNNYGRDKCYTDYTALQESLKSLKEDMGVCTIAIPYGIGCGLAGGDWVIVNEIISEVFESYEGKLQIWKL